MTRKSRDKSILSKKAELKKRRSKTIDVGSLEKSFKNKKLEMFFKIDNIVEKGEKREVSGIASAEIVDIGGDVVLHEAMKEAWADYIKFGNIREMHQPSAVGTVIAHEFLDDIKATAITVKVVDDSAWEKVKTGVYKGFSIGARILDAEFRIVDEKEVFVITKLELIEISLVDRPANQDSLIDSFKFISLSNDVMKDGILAKFMAKRKKVVKKNDEVDEVIEDEVVETAEVVEDEVVEDETPETPDTPEDEEEEVEEKDEEDEEDSEDDDDEEEEEEDEETDDDDDEDDEDIKKSKMEDEKKKKSEKKKEDEEKEKSVTVPVKVLEEILSKVSSLGEQLEKSMAFSENLVKGLDKAFVGVEKNVNEIQKSLDSFKKPKSVQKDMGSQLHESVTQTVSVEDVIGKGRTW